MLVIMPFSLLYKYFLDPSEEGNLLLFAPLIACNSMMTQPIISRLKASIIVDKYMEVFFHAPLFGFTSKCSEFFILMKESLLYNRIEFEEKNDFV